MKTWEMIKELTENPSKHFVGTPADERMSETYAKATGDGILFKNPLGTSTALYYIGFDWDWKQVKQPVGFMEAVESGKKIRVEHPYIESIDYLNIRDLLNRITSNQTMPGIELILLNGKFYIEDQGDLVK